MFLSIINPSVKTIFKLTVFLLLIFVVPSKANVAYLDQTYDIRSASCSPWVDGPERPSRAGWIYVGNTINGSHTVTWSCTPRDGDRYPFYEMVGATQVGATVYANWKKVGYALGFENNKPPLGCGVGNPIDVSSGEKFQKETDIQPLKSGIDLSRTFIKLNGANTWRFTYDRTLKLIAGDQKPNFVAVSSTYSTKSDACVKGWSNIKSTIGESWATAAATKLSGDSCQVISGGKAVRTLALYKVPMRSVLVTNDAPVQLTRQDGATVIFQNDLVQSYEALNGAKGKLEKKNTEEWRYTTSNNEVEEYSVDGKLTKIISPTGATQNLSYDPASKLLLQVIDNLGHKLVFTYTNNLVNSVTLDNTKTTSYTYAANGLIERVTHPDNTFRIYHYEDSRFPTALTGITDERNVRYATWSYDAQGRAISSEHAGGVERTLLAFNADGSTTVTNSLGKQTIYRFDYLNGAKRVVKVEGQATPNCLGANRDYTYTPEGWLESKTDWKGVKTVYSYSELGQEISRTEAFGTPEALTTTTEWHPTLYVKTKVTEREKETVYIYDENGLLVSQKTRSLIAQ